MKPSTIPTALARTNLYFALSNEPHLKTLTTSMKLIRLERSVEAKPRSALPHSFIFPLDAVIALCTAAEEYDASTLMRFAGNQDFLRVDTISFTGASRVVRAGYAILIENDAWMKFGAQFPSFMESMAEFVHGRNALAMVNAACFSAHKYSQRLARLLLEARAAFPKTDNWMLLSQQELGSLMNTRRETAAAELLELSSLNTIATMRGKVKIIDQDALRARACGCLARAEIIAEHQVDIAKRLFKGVATSTA